MSSYKGWLVSWFHGMYAHTNKPQSVARDHLRRMYHTMNFSLARSLLPTISYHIISSQSTTFHGACYMDLRWTQTQKYPACTHSYIVVTKMHRYKDNNKCMYIAVPRKQATGNGVSDSKERTFYIMKKNPEDHRHNNHPPTNPPEEMKAGDHHQVGHQHIQRASGNHGRRGFNENVTNTRPSHHHIHAE